jgi:hypothetical protein
MDERRNPLFDEKPYGYKLLKDKRAQVSRKGAVLGTISGKDYNKLLRVIQLDNIYELQLFLEKISGQLTRGEGGAGQGA